MFYPVPTFKEMRAQLQEQLRISLGPDLDLSSGSVLGTMMNALALSLCQTHQKLVLAGVIRSEDDGVDVPDQDDEGASSLQTYDPSNVVLTFNGIAITGFTDDIFIDIGESQDD